MVRFDWQSVLPVSLYYKVHRIINYEEDCSQTYVTAILWFKWISLSLSLLKLFEVTILIKNSTISKGFFYEYNYITMFVSLTFDTYQEDSN